MAIDSARLDPNRYIVLVSGPGLGAVIPPARSPGMVALEGHLLLPADVPRAHVTEETHCESSKTCSFIIQSYSRHGQVVDHNKARFKARLVGPAVTDATVTSVGGGTYNVSYIAHDVGQYKIEIVLLTVEGSSGLHCAEPQYLHAFCLAVSVKAHAPRYRGERPEKYVEQHIQQMFDPDSKSFINEI